MENNGFLSKIAKIVENLSISPSAEAKTIFAGHTGKVPESLPINYQYKTFADVLGKEPESFEEFKQLKKQLYDKLRKENPNSTPGLILKDIEQRLTEPVLNKMGITDLKDLSPKVFSALGLTPEEQARMHQIYIDQTYSNPVRTSGGKAFPIMRERGSAPIPNVTESAVIGKDDPKTWYDPHETKTYFDLPLDAKKSISTDIDFQRLPEDKSFDLKKIEDAKEYSDLITREYYENVNPTSKVAYNPIKNIPTGDKREYPYLPKAAATAFHENLHQYNQMLQKYKAIQGKKGIEAIPEYYHSQEADVKKQLKGKEAEYENAMKALKFYEHFTPEMVKGKPEYGFDYWLSRLSHPEWLEGDIRPKTTPTPYPLATPRPTPTPSPEPTPTPEPEEDLEFKEFLRELRSK